MTTAPAFLMDSTISWSISSYFSSMCDTLTGTIPTVTGVVAVLALKMKVSPPSPSVLMIKFGRSACSFFLKSSTVMMFFVMLAIEMIVNSDRDILSDSV